MALVTHTPTRSGDLLDELRAWLEENWDPDLTVGEWWERLGLSGWAAPLLPTDSYGRGLSRGDSLRVQREIAAFGALGPPAGLGLGLAAPTIATHGTREKIDRYIPDIVTGRKAWCQLFSEPGAGSDLAGLATRAVLDGEVWHVDGQKVWTSGGQFADLGMLLARTNPDVPKHQGITWFCLDMHQPGVEVRPLREMTGTALFNEVFLSDAKVTDDARIGDTHNGWAVANTTLAYERAGMGSGGRGAARGIAAMARPGTVAQDLGRRAGDVVAPAGPAATAAEPGRRGSPAKALIDLARDLGKDQDAAIRQRLARLHILGELARLNTERHKAVQAAGGDIPGIANFSKLAMADVVRLTRDLGLEILGARGMLHAYTGDDRQSLAAEVGGPAAVAITAQALRAQALPIYGGTDQIQRNIIGERTLGLPKEPGDLAHVPYSQLPRNG
ncbi:MAG TPA: acyl-CoA dehydrogenase family protein [Acidimicrobiales bacterium]|nr:acyl-CoA dehydrogenase family protein [Acidimicrobiales bacterium]